MPEDAPQPEPTIAPGAMPTTDPDAAAHAPHRTRARPGGGTIGAYTILGDKPLGSGGFGEVWLAERRTPYTQRVAIKIIKAGMDSREVIARFEQERQALAVMDHPSVAKVLDGGITPEGRPYFVMEYVRGEPITTFCDRHRLSLKQRLALFIPVCEAVQHAHLKGLIHRDLKPGNILVSFVENAGAAKRDEAKSSGAVGGMLAKVIDFGVAKATARTLTDKTIFTETGQMIGTPEYMSPEQAEMSGTDVDTRTDVYSLGVVLYELLVGLLPYDSRTLRSEGYDGIRKAIREGETPRPSTRLSGLKPDEAQHLAAARDLDVSHLVSELRREAEWIPLMALRKERDRRYQTPADLARDIGRYLEGSALVAGPESRWYKARKFAHRYRAPLAAVSVLALLLLGGFIAISLALAEAREQQRSADNERLRALAAQREAEAARGEAQSAAQAEAAQRVIVEQQAYEANILAAGAFITQNQGGAAVEALEACPLALRGWEWGWLMRRADQAAAVLGTGSPVNSATFSPDSRLIATASEDGRARIWNADGSGRSVALGVRGQKIAGALFSPDGKNVLTWSDEAEFSLWNAGTGEQVRTVDALHAVNTASFSPDGRFIVTAGADASARLWTSDGEPLRELKGHSEPIDVAAFSPDSTRVLTGSRDHTARVWRVSDGSLLAILGESSTGIEQGAFSPDGNSAITLSDRVRVWELRDEFNPRERLVQRDPQDSAKLVAELGEQGQAPSTAVFSRDGLRVIVGMYDGTIAVYGAKTGRTMRSLLGHVRSVSGIKPLKDNVHVATVGDDGTLRLWNADTAQLLRTFIGHASDIFALDVTSDGARAVTASYDGSVRLWNLGEASEDRQRTPLTLAHQKALLAPSCETALVRDGIGERRHVSLASGVGVALPPLEGTSSEWTLSSDGRTSAVALRSGAIALVDLETRRNTFTLDGHDGNVGDLAFSPDGKWLLSGGFSDKTIRLWNLETHQSVATREFDAVYNVGVSPDSKWAITAGLEHLTVFSLPTLEPVGSSSQAGASSPPFAFNPASNLLALVRFYDVVTLLRLPSAEVTLSLMLRPGAVGSLAFSPAGDRLLAASTDGALRVINVASPRAVFIDRVEPSETVAARYTPDGASIVLLTSHAAYRWGSSPRTWELQQRLRQEGRITREQQEAFVRDGVLKAWEIEPLPWVVDPAAPTAPSPSPSPRPSPPATAPPRSPPP